MSYDIAFTQGFKEGVLRLPHALYPVIDRQIEWLEADPYARNPNAKRLKNVRQTFRMRIGKDVRMLYRVDGRQQRVDLFNIGQRGSIYGDLEPTGRVLTGEEAGSMRVLLHDQGSGPSTPTEIVPQAPASPQEESVEVEHLPWVSEDELFFLGVQQDLWAAIVAAGSLGVLQQAAVPSGIRLQIEDYWTNPSATQVEKLYSLAPEQGVAAIAKQALGHFLLALDPEQKDALRRLKSDGPYLLKGSAGTGKSLVGLYHLRDLITARAGESLFDGAQARFGVITYTNTLVDANLALLQGITPASAHAGIVCTTLDSLAYRFAEKSLGFKPNALSTDGLSKWIETEILPTLKGNPAALVRSLGTPYLADEIEQAIYGHGLRHVDEYIALKREGRKKGLTTAERQDLWIVHEALEALLTKRRVQTFGQWRVLALDHIRRQPTYPRFSALFVDEAQDFSKVARQLCLELVRNPRHLVLAADTGQSIYTVPLSWKQCDPRFDFQRRKPIPLERSYRATHEISRAIAPLRDDPGDEDDRSSNANAVFSGPKPRWIDAAQADHVNVVADEVAQWVHDARNPINAGQIAIIVRDTHRVDRFAAALAARKVAAVQIKKYAPLQLAGDKVHIVTAHSCKGLGFPVVVVPDVHATAYPAEYEVKKAKDDKQREQIVDNEQRLLYVALSRASHRLVMVVDPAQPSPFINKFDRQAHWN